MRYLALAPLLLAGAAVASSAELGPFEGITFADIEKHDLFDGGCNFSMISESNTMLFLGSDNDGHLKIGGEIVTLMPDPASAHLSYGVVEVYTDDTYQVRMTVAGEGVQTGYESMVFNGKLTVRDAKGGVLFTSKGLVECGA